MIIKMMRKMKKMRMLMINRIWSKCREKGIQKMNNMSNRSMMMNKILREMERMMWIKIKYLMHSMDWIRFKKKIKNRMEWAQILISIYKVNSFQIYHKNK